MLLLCNEVQTGTSISTYPSPDGTVPSNDRARNPRMILDSRIAHDDTSLQTSTRSDFCSWADDDIGTDQSGGVDLGGLKEREYRKRTADRKQIWL